MAKSAPKPTPSTIINRTVPRAGAVWPCPNGAIWVRRPPLADVESRAPLCRIVSAKSISGQCPPPSCRTVSDLYGSVSRSLGPKLGPAFRGRRVLQKDSRCRIEAQPAPSDTIYVDYSVPATLRYSETMAFYLTLREAITAWLALSNEGNKVASITTNEGSGAQYQGWEIYRLWGRWDS